METINHYFVYDFRFNLKYLHGSDEFSNLKSTLREGCYCPSGTTLLRHNSNICVPSCGKCNLIFIISML